MLDPACLTCKGRGQHNTLDGVCVLGHAGKHVLGATYGWLNELLLWVCYIPDKWRSCMKDVFDSLEDIMYSGLGIKTKLQNMTIKHMRQPVPAGLSQSCPLWSDLPHAK